MKKKGNPAYLAFLVRPAEISSAAMEAFKQAHTRPVLEISEFRTAKLSQIITSYNADDVMVSPEHFMSPEFKDIIAETGIHHIYVEYQPAASEIEPAEFLERLRELSKTCGCIPVTSDVDLLAGLVRMEDPPRALALKGYEASGIVSTEATGLLLANLKRLSAKTLKKPAFMIWGGIFTQEAAAAYLCSGAEAILFESLHWLTDQVLLEKGLKRSIARLRPEHTAVIGLGLGMPVRIFDKGNSKAAKALRDKADAIADGAATDCAGEFADYFLQEAVSALESGLQSSELIPLSHEAAFAESFATRFGPLTAKAIRSFSQEVWRLCGEAGNMKKRFTSDQRSIKDPIQRQHVAVWLLCACWVDGYQILNILGGQECQEHAEVRINRVFWTGLSTESTPDKYSCIHKMGSNTLIFLLYYWGGSGLGIF